MLKFRVIRTNSARHKSLIKDKESALVTVNAISDSSSKLKTSLPTDPLSSILAILARGVIAKLEREGQLGKGRSLRLKLQRESRK